MRKPDLDDKIDEDFLKSHPQIRTALEREGIHTYGPVMEMGYEKLRLLRHMGPISLRQLQDHLIDIRFEGIRDFKAMEAKYRNSFGG